jgi:hypothetical protein
MAISTNIRREHVLLAINHIDKFPLSKRKEGRKYFLQIGKISYGINEVICIANFFANGVLLLHDPNDFNSVQAKNFLEGLDFDVLII